LSLNERSTVAASKDQVSCEVAGEAAILNLKNGAYYDLNPVGARIWKLIQEPRTFGELRDMLLEEYDVEPARLEADMRDLLDDLAELKLVEITE